MEKNKYIAAYLNLRMRAYRDIMTRYNSTERILEVNWHRQYTNVDSALKLKDITSKKIRVR